MIHVMVNGIPGNMGKIVAETCVKRGLFLVPYSLTGEEIEQDECEVAGKAVKLLRPSNRDKVIGKILEEFSNMLCIDFTHPSAVNMNAEFYVRYGIPFVMGTTGGDREALMDLVRKVGHPCVIAPNMAKQIVAFQAMFEYLASEFPGAFEGYKLSVIESHQKTKADTSGTAKAVVASLNKLGPKFSEEEIVKVRTEREQLEEMHVPEEFLGGHAFHTYSLDSEDGTVHFEFKHNVCGRKIYAEGTVDAVKFLSKQLELGNPGQFSMMDVLRSGGMR